LEFYCLYYCRPVCFYSQEASSIGIIGGADGPTAIYTTARLAPHLLSAIAIAAYSYMALIPIIQPPIMRLLTTERGKKSKNGAAERSFQAGKNLLPHCGYHLLRSCCLPSVAPLIGMLMLGNLFRESGVVERLSDTAQNALMNIVTIFLGVTVGATANAENFLKLETLAIIALGLVAFV
jgi:sodium ion-translocating decarboxylase beta subunit